MHCEVKLIFGSWQLNKYSTYLVILICRVTTNIKKPMLLGVPFEKVPKQKVVEQKWCIFDPILVKPKCVWELVVNLKNCKQITKSKQLFKNR